MQERILQYYIAFCMSYKQCIHALLTKNVVIVNYVTVSNSYIVVHTDLS
jgi:hypothetical protein